MRSLLSAQGCPDQADGCRATSQSANHLPVHSATHPFPDFDDRKQHPNCESRYGAFIIRAWVERSPPRSGSSRSRVGTFEWKTKRRTKVRVAPQDRFTPVLTNTSRDQPHNSLRVCTKLVYRATTTDGSINFIDRLPHLHHFV